jgi:hypothetical protein
MEMDRRPILSRVDGGYTYHLPSPAESHEMRGGRNDRLLGAGDEGTLPYGTEEEHHGAGDVLFLEDILHLAEEILPMVNACNEDPAHPGRAVLHLPASLLSLSKHPKEI